MSGSNRKNRRPESRSELWEPRASGAAQPTPPGPPAEPAALRDLPGNPVAALVGLSHELGREDRRMALLAEGNASVRTAQGMLVKASGRRMATLTPSDLVACRREPLLAFLEAEKADDERVKAVLLESREEADAPKPSVEAMFHAWLLGLPGVLWVGHAHPIAANRVLCSPRAPEFAARRLFPDEIVCCGTESVLVPYTDPGLTLAVAIRRRTEKFMDKHGAPPRVILLANHGVITLGPTPEAVLAAMLMTEKAAEIFVGAALLGGPVFLSGADVRRIADRSDEHERRAELRI